jgi:hypothetical protein
MHTSNNHFHGMEKSPRFPSSERHAVFQNKTVYEINRARNEAVDYRGLGPEELRERLRMEVYFNVKDLIDGRASEEEVFGSVFRLMDIYAGR